MHLYIFVNKKIPILLRHNHQNKDILQFSPQISLLEEKNLALNSRFNVHQRWVWTIVVKIKIQNLGISHVIVICRFSHYYVGSQRLSPRYIYCYKSRGLENLSCVFHISFK